MGELSSQVPPHPLLYPLGKHPTHGPGSHAPGGRRIRLAAPIPASQRRLMASMERGTMGRVNRLNDLPLRHGFTPADNPSVKRIGRNHPFPFRRRGRCKTGNSCPLPDIAVFPFKYNAAVLEHHTYIFANPKACTDSIGTHAAYFKIPFYLF